MQQLAEDEVVGVWQLDNFDPSAKQRWTNGAGSRPCETHTPSSQSQPRLDPGELSAKPGEDSVPAGGRNGDTMLSRFHTLSSRESRVRISQPPLPAPLQVWAGSARAARRLAGYRRLVVYRMPCVL